MSWVEGSAVTIVQVDFEAADFFLAGIASARSRAAVLRCASLSFRRPKMSRRASEQCAAHPLQLCFFWYLSRRPALERGEEVVGHMVENNQPRQETTVENSRKLYDLLCIKLYKVVYSWIKQYKSI